MRSLSDANTSSTSKLQFAVVLRRGFPGGRAFRGFEHRVICLSSPLTRRHSPPARPRFPRADPLEPYLWMHVLWLHGSGGWLEPRRYLGQNQEQPVDVGEFGRCFIVSVFSVFPLDCCVPWNRRARSLPESPSHLFPPTDGLRDAHDLSPHMCEDCSRCLVEQSPGAWESSPETTFVAGGRPYHRATKGFLEVEEACLTTSFFCF